MSRHYSDNAKWLKWFAPFRQMSISAAYLVPFFLSKGLSQTEVMLLRLEGLTHSDIAVRRCTALSTVANLLSAAYRRLRISGRLELMARLASEYQLGNVPVPTLEEDAGPPFKG